MFDKLKGRSNDAETPPSQASQSSRTAPPPYEASGHDDRPASNNNRTALPMEEPTSAFRTNFASVSLHMADRIRLMCLPQDVCDAVRTSIMQTWPNGIQSERNYYGSWEFKLRGLPWAPAGDNGIHARRLTRGVIMTLYHYGWVLYISTDISMKPGDKDSLFFRHQDPVPAPCEWFSCTFSRGDRLRLIDAPDDLVQDIISTLSPWTQSHEPFMVRGVYEIKFNGYPFAAEGSQTMSARKMVLQLLAALDRHGFTVHVSLDQKYGGEHMRDTDSWHLSRPQAWLAGAPVYHQ